MGLALRRKQYDYGKILVVLLALSLWLVPSVALAISWVSAPTIGMSGVNSSDLTVGMTGTGGDLLVDFGAPGALLPTSVAFNVAIIIPIVFLFLFIMLMIAKTMEPGLNLETLLLIGILAVIGLALMSGVNLSIYRLLGG